MIYLKNEDTYISCYKIVSFCYNFLDKPKKQHVQTKNFYQAGILSDSNLQIEIENKLGKVCVNFLIPH